MKAERVIGFAVLLMVLQKCHAVEYEREKTVSLNEMLREYIDKYNQSTETVKSWGMTRNYSYWSLGYGKEDPVSATVDLLKCEKFGPEHELYGGKNFRCEETATLDIINPIESPVELRAQALVPFIQKRFQNKPPTRTVAFDLNNATRVQTPIIRTPRLRIHSRDIVTIYWMNCRFTTTIRFKGNFVFHDTVADDVDYYEDMIEGGVFVVEKVGKLATVNNKFKRTGKDELEYTIHGVYTEQLCGTSRYRGRAQ
ncbi:uncharacterized protein LOC144166537 [Haemaphysalis longicornis]